MPGAFLPLLSRAPFAAYAQLHFGVEPEQLDAALAGCVAHAREGAHVYTCGPSPFMERVVAAGEARVPAEAIHLERFAADPSVPAAGQEAALDTFDVQVASTGETVRVDKDTSIVAARQPPSP